MTIDSFASITITNILLIAMIISGVIVGWWLRPRRTSEQLLRRALRVKEVLQHEASNENNGLNLWLVAEAVLLVRIASQFGIALLPSDDPAWEWMRQRKLEEAARRDPTFLQRVKDGYASMPEGVRSLLMGMLKKANSAIVEPWLGGKSGSS